MREMTQGHRLATGRFSRRELERWYLEEGLSQVEIAKRLECSRQAVSKAMRVTGLTARDKSAAAQARAKKERERAERERQAEEVRQETAKLARRRERNAASQRRHRKKYPERALARDTFNEAVRKSLILRRGCSKCNSPDGEGHHPDYDQPYLVAWLCRSCHGRELEQPSTLLEVVHYKPPGATRILSYPEAQAAATGWASETWSEPASSGQHTAESFVSKRFART